jgi:hypothetical protein
MGYAGWRRCRKNLAVCWLDLSRSVSLQTIRLGAPPLSASFADSAIFLADLGYHLACLNYELRSDHHA